MKKILIILFLIIIIGGAYIFRVERTQKTIVLDYKNTSYVIENNTVTLVNGIAEESEAPGSASTILTQYFGNEVRADFDADGREDIAFIITQSGGGSGTFYYLVYALNKETGYIGSQGLFI